MFHRRARIREIFNPETFGSVPQTPTKPATTSTSHRTEILFVFSAKVQNPNCSECPNARNVRAPRIVFSRTLGLIDTDETHVRFSLLLLVLRVRNWSSCGNTPNVLAISHGIKAKTKDLMMSQSKCTHFNFLVMLV